MKSRSEEFAISTNRSHSAIVELTKRKGATLRRSALRLVMSPKDIWVDETQLLPT
jgi:hypothetical protein